jgi:hypothetical protein
MRETRVYLTTNRRGETRITYDSRDVCKLYRVWDCEAAGVTCYTKVTTVDVIPDDVERVERFLATKKKVIDAIEEKIPRGDSFWHIINVEAGGFAFEVVYKSAVKTQADIPYSIISYQISLAGELSTE